MNKFFVMVVISVAIGGYIYLHDPARDKVASSAPADSQKLLELTPGQGGAAPPDSQRLLDYPASQGGAPPVDTQQPQYNTPAAAEPTRTTSMNSIGTTEQEFENDVIKSPAAVVVEFWRPGCKYCAQLEPELAKLAAGLPDKYKIVKVNTRECPETTRRFSVTGVPSLYLFENGKITKVFGGRTAQEIRDELGLS